MFRNALKVHQHATKCFKMLQKTPEVLQKCLTSREDYEQSTSNRTQTLLCILFNLAIARKRRCTQPFICNLFNVPVYTMHPLTYCQTILPVYTMHPLTYCQTILNPPISRTSIYTTSQLTIYFPLQSRPPTVHAPTCQPHVDIHLTYIKKNITLQKPTKYFYYYYQHKYSPCRCDIVQDVQARLHILDNITAYCLLFSTQIVSNLTNTY